MPRRVVDALDAYQRRHRWLGLPLAVAYEFGDDQGPYLTTLMTYYGFLSHKGSRSSTSASIRRRRRPARTTAAP